MDVGDALLVGVGDYLVHKAHQGVVGFRHLAPGGLDGSGFLDQFGGEVADEDFLLLRPGIVVVDRGEDVFLRRHYRNDRDLGLQSQRLDRLEFERILHCHDQLGVVADERHHPQPLGKRLVHQFQGIGIDVEFARVDEGNPEFLHQQPVDRAAFGDPHVDQDVAESHAAIARLLAQCFVELLLRDQVFLQQRFADGGLGPRRLLPEHLLQAFLGHDLVGRQIVADALRAQFLLQFQPRLDLRLGGCVLGDQHLSQRNTKVEVRERRRRNETTHHFVAGDDEIQIQAMALLDESFGFAGQPLAVAELNGELLIRGNLHDFDAFFGEFHVPRPEGHRSDEPQVFDFVERNLKDFAVLHGPEFDHFFFREETQDIAE